ncbi:multicopper oxidase family protein [Jhaorihella thermophila]|uniref:Multicopper oxidase with three cupredoxin domains (Includes cell division protein FtsP and spore coat protein CotA) n=1 Tax=Jhaorihella thermophila TaxID=488547 RepID=A0A1H5WY15_9RHOB|nr:multicopper oxidase family protein [Jhaorihella thermophila]SEG04394.1 Multicopper oxidase with three cupredoxin domains (includes cell division protein FtsP and spore coat protein CotA) [Jhaorihella thermophila]
MPMSRRRFLAGSAATAAVAAAPLRAGQAPDLLTAAPADQQVAPEGYARTAVWAYDGTVPGPVLRVPQGGRVRRRLLNALPVETAVHWHGVRIDNAMDGVPGLTQAPVPPGGSFDYDFAVRDAGTFWYHSHQRSMEQVERGLHGVLVVEEPEPPELDHDLPLVIDDWRLDPETAQLIAGFDKMHDLSHAGRLGNLISVNGRFDPAQTVRRHDRLRLRLINAATARIFPVGLDGMEGWLIALDGMPLAQPVAVTGAFTLAPAQRADLIVDVTAEAGGTASLVTVERDGAYGIARFPVAGQAAGIRREAPNPLPPNPLPRIADPAAAPLHAMTMTGGAMAWLSEARLNGETLDGRALAQRGKFWALNGVADRDTAPFIDAHPGETHRIAFVNDTMFPHAMHLHGHHFREITDSGALGPWRDTILVERGRTRQVVMVADNPGDWLLHCHMLGHARAGMASWIRVA